MNPYSNDDQLRLMIERYTERRDRLRRMIADGYVGGRKLQPSAAAELGGQAHELGLFVDDLKNLLEGKYE